MVSKTRTFGFYVPVEISKLASQTTFSVRGPSYSQSHFFLEAIYLIQNKYYQIETTTTVPSIKKTDFLKSKYSFPETPSIILDLFHHIIGHFRPTSVSEYFKPFYMIKYFRTPTLGAGFLDDKTHCITQ